MGNRIIDKILLFISELFNLRKNHLDRVTNKRTTGLVRNDINVETVGKTVYLTGWLKWDTGKMPTRGDTGIYLGYLPEELMPFNEQAVVFATYGEFATDANIAIRLVMSNQGIRFYNAGTGASSAEIFYYATWELEKIPSGGGQSLKSLLRSFLNGRRCSYVYEG